VLVRRGITLAILVLAASAEPWPVKSGDNSSEVHPLHSIQCNHTGDLDPHNHTGHDHKNCGHNSVVQPWMKKQMEMFDVGKEAAQAMARTRVSAAAGVQGTSEKPEPVRIHTEFQLNDMQDYSKRHFLKYQLVPRMVAEIRRRILIKQPVDGNLRIPRYCSMYYVREDGAYNCAQVADQEYCSSPEVGIKHNQEYMEGYTICNNTLEDSCTATAGGLGIREADFLLYVAANDVSFCQEGQIVAFAGTCALDLDNNRPLAGFANFCPDNVDTDPENFQDLLETAIHEALHALFFSELLFPYYLDEEGNRRTGVVELSPLGHKIVTTPTVVKTVREHFGCDSLRGAPLENEGGSGTAGNHWESSVFQGELMDGMSGAPNERAVFSAVTMALLQDTGWYSPNWELQGNFGFGRGAGCPFVEESCSQRVQDRQGPQWFCPSGSTHDACSWDLKSVGRCSSELLLDGCIAPVTYRNMHCLQPTLLKDRQTDDSWMWGFGYGPSSRCIREIGPVTKTPGDGFKYTKFTGDSNLECYSFTCRGSQLHVMVGEYELPCPTGETVDLTSVGYLSGRLGPCPDNQEICEQLSCPNMCSGQGTCRDGKCFCSMGYTGDDCSDQTCLHNTCPRGQACNLMSGLCQVETKVDPPSSTCDSNAYNDTSLSGVMSYLWDISAADALLGDCYTSSFGTTGKPPLAEEMEAPPINIPGPAVVAVTATTSPEPAATSAPEPTTRDTSGKHVTDGGAGAAGQGSGWSSSGQIQEHLTPGPTPGARFLPPPPAKHPEAASPTSTPEQVAPSPPPLPSQASAGWRPSSPPQGQPTPPMHESRQVGQQEKPQQAPRTGSEVASRPTGATEPEAKQDPAGALLTEIPKEARVRVVVQVNQIDGSKPLSNMQADRIKAIMAASAGVHRNNVTFKSMDAPEEGSAGPYTLEIEIESLDAVRVVSSIRSAESYGILSTRLQDEAKVRELSIDVMVVQESEPEDTAGWIMFVVVVAVIVFSTLCCGAALLLYCCRRAKQTAVPARPHTFAVEPRDSADSFSSSSTTPPGGDATSPQQQKGAAADAGALPGAKPLPQACGRKAQQWLASATALPVAEGDEGLGSRPLTESGSGPPSGQIATAGGTSPPRRPHRGAKGGSASKYRVVDR